MITFTFVAGIVAIAGLANAAPEPSEPSLDSVFNAGSTCKIEWNVDPTGSWKKMNIQLMTGDNFKMVHLTTVAQNIDATDPAKNTFEYPCPEVTPNSAIYFYQFSSPTEPTNTVWTSRWTIASSDGKTTPPAETTQPDGQKIPWGTGALVDPSKAVAAPSYLSESEETGESTTSSTACGTTSTSASHPAAASSNPAAAAAPAATHAGTTTTTHATSARSTSGTATHTPSGSALSSTPPTANAALSAAAPGVVIVLGAVLAAVGLF